jgi:hypothetical protein
MLATGCLFTLGIDVLQGGKVLVSEVRDLFYHVAIKHRKM